ncbi:MAG TPA: DUF262 domain-containing HNH endonuclease family protein [Pyrinomonadaceae bacterium]|nr:DUF262 domain-containing HNH endonuclease family protein [Pyrinomonadaceae bacterium]
MKDLDGKTIAIGNLLSQEFFFRVPDYQRPFSWEPDNFEDLIDDILTANKNQDYFLGTIVLHNVSKGNYEIVDGQQRLTSVLILMACLRDKVELQSFKEGIQDKIVQRENVVDGIPEKVRLEVKDREIFKDLVVNEKGTLKERRADDLPEPDKRYVQAVTTFKTYLEPLAEEAVQTLIKFLNQRCVVIYLATSTFDDAFRLFTIVNDRGKQLRRIDVLKSINMAPDVVSKKTVRDRIAQTWEDLEKDLGEATFESVFHLLRLILLKDKPQGDLLKEFEDRVFSRGIITKGEVFVDLVFKYASLYKKVFVDRDIVPKFDANEVPFRNLIHIMDSEFKASEWRACVLFFAFKFQGESIYELCLKMEKVYLEQWFGGVRKDERYAAYSKILGRIESAKKAREVLDDITYNEDTIRDKVGMKKLYESTFSKYVLLRLELVAAEHDVVKEFNPKSIEHVLPQNPPATGYWASHFTLAEISDFVDTVGNLVLISKSKNSSASNKDFLAKKDTYLKNRVSDYPRSIEVLGYADWDKTEILTRTEEAKSKFLQDL